MISSDIESVLLQSKLYKCLPSEIIGIDKEDTYTAYCFNEACAYIMVKLEEGKERPKYKDVEEKKIRERRKKAKNYKSFKDFYSQFN